MGSAKDKVVPELKKEREKCTFDVEELTNYIDDGREKTIERRRIENLVLKEERLKDKVPEEYLSWQERYENAIRKACILTKITQKIVGEELKHDLDSYGTLLTKNVSHAVFKDVSPFMVHFGMFLPTIMGQGTDEQKAKWLQPAWNMNIIGTYAQTEMGHGTFIRGLETTATYDTKTQQFVLNSPTLTSYKWWPGGLAHTANHCIVVAQLYSKGKCYGIHPFMVQIRDLDTHMPLPGIKIGEIGAKMGFNTANNGFLGFDNYKIPRNALLMKYAQVLEDGTYLKSTNSRLSYGTMIFVRVLMVDDAWFFLAKAVTVAIRYSAVRHQSRLTSTGPETQILDYSTQQHKLFNCLATCHAFRITGRWLWKAYTEFIANMQAGNLDSLPELHALSCCLKAVSTADAASGVERCRLACGGHGYMLSSNLPFTYAATHAACTYEGENTVMLLQTARYLLKAWQQMTEGKPMAQTLLYLANFQNQRYLKWENTTSGIIRGFEILAAGKLSSCVENLQNYIMSGMSEEDAWNATSVQLAATAEAHCRAVIASVYYSETLNNTTHLSRALREVLLQLVDLYLVYWALEKLGDLLRYTTISEKDINELQKWYEDLLRKIRPNAIGLVDSFDIRDEILKSTLGAYDGRVYERLMEEALKSPLNKTPVNKSFNKYLKPFMQGKL